MNWIRILHCQEKRKPLIRKSDVLLLFKPFQKLKTFGKVLLNDAISLENA
jgi:hypothetical protein